MNAWVLFVSVVAIVMIFCCIDDILSVVRLRKPLSSPPTPPDLYEVCLGVSRKIGTDGALGHQQYPNLFARDHPHEKAYIEAVERYIATGELADLRQVEYRAAQFFVSERQPKPPPYKPYKPNMK